MFGRRKKKTLWLCSLTAPLLDTHNGGIHTARKNSRRFVREKKGKTKRK